MILQGIILVGGLVTIFLLTRTAPRSRMWGCIVGAIVEPVWLVDSWLDDNWGIFVLGILYGILYVEGAVKAYVETRA